MWQAQLLQMWRAGIFNKGNSVKPDTMLRHVYIGVWKQDSESHTQAQLHQVYYTQSAVISCRVPQVCTDCDFQNPVACGALATLNHAK